MKNETIFTIEKAQEMSIKELQEITWDWYKDVHGFRPRHWTDASRDEMLKFIEYELMPETQVLRKKQWLKEEEMLTKMEEEFISKPPKRKL